MSAVDRITVRLYRKHARDRMAQRRVSEEDVLCALNNFVDRRETPKRSVLYIGPGVSGAPLKVWVFPDGHDLSGPKVVKSVARKDDDD